MVRAVHGKDVAVVDVMQYLMGNAFTSFELRLEASSAASTSLSTPTPFVPSGLCRRKRKLRIAWIKGSRLLKMNEVISSSRS